MIVTGRAQSQLAPTPLERESHLELISSSCATCLMGLFKPDMRHREHFLLVTDAMGAVWTLLSFLLAVWLAKGFYIPFLTRMCLRNWQGSVANVRLLDFRQNVWAN